MSAPAVSVLMSVRNGAPWVREAVESVLDQTAGDLELIVIDDGSTDQTAALLGTFQDSRMRVECQAPRGLTPSLNRAVTLARAPLLARLDADDLAMPERLARQRAFLDAHLDVGLLGTGARQIDASGREAGVVSPPESDAAIRRALIRRNPFVHSSVMVRRSVLAEAGGYDESFTVAQDYDLWMRMSRITRLANLSAPLVVRRLLPGRVSAAHDSGRLAAEARVRWRAVRSGTYPWWCVVFTMRPVLALALPGRIRRGARAALRAAGAAHSGTS
ncbi:MAG TPA: glycosyltransferase [Candidatus Methylomirabilis sp.]|nr:glycosyltransferase [Candidatus Methylomirabilis sp.]